MANTWKEFMNKALVNEVINSKDPTVFKNITHSKIKNEYDSIKWALKNMEIDSVTKKKWKEVQSLLDKALEKIITI